MPLLVVPLAPEQVGALALDELDRLASCERVMFENPTHPLIGRLRAMGVDAGPFDDEPDAARSGWALVADPRSTRVIDLARSGAEVTSGIGDSDGLAHRCARRARPARSFRGPEQRGVDHVEVAQ